MFFQLFHHVNVSLDSQAALRLPAFCTNIMCSMCVACVYQPYVFLGGKYTNIIVVVVNYVANVFGVTAMYC